MAQAFANQPKIVQVGDKKLIIGPKLGEGGFGVVNKVKDAETSTVYALKEILCSADSDIDNALHEVEIMKQISHENVIAVIEAYQFRTSQGLHMLILTEYCAGRNLNERLTRPSCEEMNIQ